MKASGFPRAVAGGDMMATIFDAIDQADFGKVWQLVQNKQDLEIIDSDSGLTPLSLAAELGLTEIVRTLLEAGVDPGHGGATTPLESSVLEGDPEIVKMLLAAGADVNQRVGEGFTPLMTAAVAGDIEIARLLLEAGAAPRAKNEDSHTAIDLAFMNDHEELGRELRAFSRKRFEEDKAAEEERAQTEEQKRIEQRRRDRQLRIAAARARRGPETQERDAEADAGPPPTQAEVPASHVAPAAVAAAKEGPEPSPSDSRPTRGASPDYTRRQDRSSSSLEPIGALSELEAPRTAADAAAAFDALFGSIDRGLAGPDPDAAQGLDRFKAFLETTPEGARRMVLLEEIDPNERDADRCTPLMLAAQFGAAETVQALLEAGAEVDAVDHSETQETALIKAINHASANRLEVITRLVNAGADLERRHGETGMTPLMFAATADVYVPDPHSKIFGGTTRHLIQLGADLEAVDHQGNTVWRLIKQNALASLRTSPFRRRLFDMNRVLEAAGAKP